MFKFYHVSIFENRNDLFEYGLLGHKLYATYIYIIFKQINNKIILFCFKMYFWAVYCECEWVLRFLLLRIHDIFKHYEFGSKYHNMRLILDKKCEDFKFVTFTVKCKIFIHTILYFDLSWINPISPSSNFKYILYEMRVKTLFCFEFAFIYRGQ